MFGRRGPAWGHTAWVGARVVQAARNPSERGVRHEQARGAAGGVVPCGGGRSGLGGARVVQVVRNPSEQDMRYRAGAGLGEQRPDMGLGPDVRR
jgi:hypothetical protein